MHFWWIFNNKFVSNCRKSWSIFNFCNFKTQNLFIWYDDKSIYGHINMKTVKVGYKFLMDIIKLQKAFTTIVRSLNYDVQCLMFMWISTKFQLHSITSFQMSHLISDYALKSDQIYSIFVKKFHINASIYNSTWL